MSSMAKCCRCHGYFKPFTARFEVCDLKRNYSQPNINCGAAYGVDRWCIGCIKKDQEEHIQDYHSSVELV